MLFHKLINARSYRHGRRSTALVTRAIRRNDREANSLEAPHGRVSIALARGQCSARPWTITVPPHDQSTVAINRRQRRTAPIAPGDERQPVNGCHVVRRRRRRRIVALRQGLGRDGGSGVPGRAGLRRLGIVLGSVHGPVGRLETAARVPVQKQARILRAPRAKDGPYRDQRL